MFTMVVTQARVALVTHDMLLITEVFPRYLRKIQKTPIGIRAESGFSPSGTQRIMDTIQQRCHCQVLYIQFIQSKKPIITPT